MVKLHRVMVSAFLLNGSFVCHRVSPTSPEPLSGIISSSVLGKGIKLAKKPARDIIPKGGGIFDNVSLQVKLILRLLRDRRINLILKLLPIGTLIYLFIPDIALGPIDDALVIWLGSVLFVELCPPEIVQEHRDALMSVIEGEWREIEQDEETSLD
jgi:hypothetical protein